MDSMNIPKTAVSNNSNVTGAATNSKPATSGLSVAKSVPFNRGEEFSGNTSQTYQKNSDRGGDAGGGSTVVQDSGAAGDGIRRWRNTKSYWSGRKAPHCRRGSSGFVFNPNINISPSKYQNSFTSEISISPLLGCPLQISNASTAGAAGGGDAPYLDASGSNTYKYSTVDMRRPYHSLNDISYNVEPVADNNSTVHQRFDESYFTRLDAMATAAAIAKRTGRYSRKVFVGGLPPDINEEQIINSFGRFGQLIVDWPHKITSKSKLPPKGYAFLIFHDERSVHQLISACLIGDDKLYICISSSAIKGKPVQIRPWLLSDASCMLDDTIPVDPRKMIFVGGVPRPLKANELAMLMHRLYGGVSYVGIDTDTVLQYPKGAARVAFSNRYSYIAAISARFVQLHHDDIDKCVEVKPYVMGNQMCDECQGQLCGGKYAPFFCTNTACLKYYCQHCWTIIHSHPGREYHKPLFKEAGNRSRVVPFRWF